MDDRNKQIPPPSSWTIFEDLCLSLFKTIWNDPHAQKNGRAGQSQQGVDVWGSYNSDSATYQGVQCKGKDALYGSVPTIDEIKKEIAKAEKFQPLLSHWRFATTAPRDGTLQKEVRLISKKRKEKGLFTVDILGWDDFRDLLCEYKKVLRDYYPECGFDYAELISAASQKSKLNESEESYWEAVVFEEYRDMSTALLGYSLGINDVFACPQLDSVQMVCSSLKKGYSCRLIGDSGVGKTVSAYQVAHTYLRSGWRVVRLRKNQYKTIESLTYLDTDENTLYIIDDGHLLDVEVLNSIEERATSTRLVLSTINTFEGNHYSRNAVFIDSKRAVINIAQFC